VITLLALAGFNMARVWTYTQVSEGPIVSIRYTVWLIIILCHMDWI